MRTSLDIPDDLYRKIKIHIAERGITLREFLLASAKEALKANGVASDVSQRGNFGILDEHIYKPD